jgi:hypothetical protein
MREWAVWLFDDVINRDSPGDISTPSHRRGVHHGTPGIPQGHNRAQKLASVFM